MSYVVNNSKRKIRQLTEANTTLTEANTILTEEKAVLQESYNTLSGQYQQLKSDTDIANAMLEACLNGTTYTPPGSSS